MPVVTATVLLCVKAVQNINRTKISLQWTSILMIVNNVNTTQNVALTLRLICFDSEEEAQQVQEKMDALRIRCSVLSLSSLDVLQRLEQALEASSRCTSSQEDLHLWLGRIERELLGAAGAQTHAGDAVLCAAERQRVMSPQSCTMNTVRCIFNWN